MSTSEEISAEDFAALCRCVDLTLAPDEAVRLRAAYVGMKVLLNRLPRDTDFFPEPAVVYAHPDTRLAG
jgi:hypothetical protein